MREANVVEATEDAAGGPLSAIIVFAVDVGQACSPRMKTCRAVSDPNELRNQ